MVTNGPPSFGQLTICGRLLIWHLAKFIGAPRPVFIGRADNAVSPTLAYLNGCFIAFKGSDFKSTNVLILSSVSLKINFDLSSVPNRLDTAGNLLPFTFSKRIAGP